MSLTAWTSRSLDARHVSRMRMRLACLSEQIHAAITRPNAETLSAVIDAARWARFDVDDALAFKGHVADLRDAHWRELRFETPMSARAVFEAFTAAHVRTLGLVETRNLRALLDGLLNVARGWLAALGA